MTKTCNSEKIKQIEADLCDVAKTLLADPKLNAKSKGLMEKMSEYAPTLAKLFYMFEKQEESKDENKCAYCGKLFETQQIYYSVDMEGNHFCSKKCVLKSLEEPKQEEADSG